MVTRDPKPAVEAATVANTPFQWLVRKSGSQLIGFSEPAAIQAWIAEGKLEATDEISRDGTNWQYLGNIVEFRPTFAARSGQASRISNAKTEWEPPLPHLQKKLDNIQVGHATPAMRKPLPRSRSSGYPYAGRGGRSNVFQDDPEYGQILDGWRPGEGDHVVEDFVKQQRWRRVAAAGGIMLGLAVIAGGIMLFSRPQGGAMQALRDRWTISTQSAQVATAKTNPRDQAAEAAAARADTQAPQVAETEAAAPAPKTEVAKAEAPPAPAPAATPAPTPAPAPTATPAPTPAPAPAGKQVGGRSEDLAQGFAAKRAAAPAAAEDEDEGNRGTSLINQAQAQLNRGNAQAALRLFEKAADRGNAAAGLTGMGYSYLQLGKPEAALTNFKKATMAAPKDAEAWWGAAISLDNLGRTSEAQQAYEKYLELAPKGRHSRAARQALQGLGAG